MSATLISGLAAYTRAGGKSSSGAARDRRTSGLEEASLPMACQRRSGQVLPIITLALVPLIACVGLALDVGFFQNQRRKIQIAADGAAITAKREILAGNPGTATAAAKNDATS